MSEIRDALSYVDPTDRETWVRMGMSVKAELGEEGFEIWDQWSAQADSYRPRDAKAVWRSIKPYGGVTGASLFAEARANGYTGEGRPLQPRTREHQVDEQEERRRAQARQKALSMISRAEYGWHQYLVNKGHANVHGLVLDDLLLVPMRDLSTGVVNSLQSITVDGQKKFLSGGRAKGSVFVIGSGKETYLCEGYATGLSVKAALDSLYRKARVVVCFSAANLAHVAKRLGGYVIADNDASGIGQKYAEQTGLPWWMPPTEGDANDFHLWSGERALAIALNELRRQKISA